MVVNHTIKTTPINLGLKSATEYLKALLKLLESYGVNHVILNLKHGSRPADEMIAEIGENVTPYFFDGVKLNKKQSFDYKFLSKGSLIYQTQLLFQ